VARHRDPPPRDDPAALPPIEVHVTRSSYDIQGNLLGIRDALGRLAFEYVYDLTKRPLRTESIDAGRKLAVLDAAGNPVESRDAKGALVLHAHDKLNRPTHLWARDAAGEPVTQRERLIYDSDPDSPGDAAERNLLGKLFRHHDESGVVTMAEYDFKGNALRSSRQVLSDDFMLANFKAHVEGTDWNLKAPRADWADAPANLLDTRVYETRSAFDALGRAKWSEYPQCANGERYRLRPGYNHAGALERVDLEGPLAADGSGALEPYVQSIAYNAKGQRALIVYGNGLITRYAYDAQTFRLVRLRTDRLGADPAPLGYQPKGAPLQDIAYRYDLVGNILSMLDRTPGCGVANNPEVILQRGPLQELLSQGDALLRCFEYDPLYRLTSATGREGTKMAGKPRPWGDVPREGYDSGNHGTPNQGNAPDMTSLYWEEYNYDAAGNMLTLRHSQCLQQGGTVGWNVAWSRRFGMGQLDPARWRYESAGHVVGEWAGRPSNQLTHVQDRASGVQTTPLVAQSHFYDTSGNMLQEHNVRHFEWDHADRMKVFRNQIDASKPTVYALYLYDAGGQRVKKLVVTGNGYRTTNYLGSAFEHHAGYDKLDGSGKLENCSLHVMDDKSRVAIVRVGPAFRDDGAAAFPMQYHLGDHLGSSGVVVSGGGDWINREEFFPFGETSLGSFGRKRFRFASCERDEESGLQRHGVRFVCLPLVRWISTDKLGPKDAINLYSFSKNAPINTLDTNGFETPQNTTQPETNQCSELTKPTASQRYAVDAYRELGKIPSASRTGGTNIQAHHPIQDKFAKSNIEGYSSGDAPTQFLETKGSENPAQRGEHTKISVDQNANRPAGGDWSKKSYSDARAEAVKQYETAELMTDAKQGKIALLQSDGYFFSLSDKETTDAAGVKSVEKQGNLSGQLESAGSRTPSASSKTTLPAGNSDLTRAVDSSFAKTFKLDGVTNAGFAILQIRDLVMLVIESSTEKSDLAAKGWHNIEHDLARPHGLFYQPGADLPLDSGTRVMQDGIPGRYFGNGYIDFMQ
jgi:RHS repeat-associated protein